jgi:hypothetical protein
MPFYSCNVPAGSLTDNQNGPFLLLVQLDSLGPLVRRPPGLARRRLTELPSPRPRVFRRGSPAQT